MDGILNILKPPGMTSQNVVSHVKRILKVKKAGHTGTLDPGAAGVLPVCIGKSTRVSEYLINDKKSYRAEMKIGYMSSTLDKYSDMKDLKFDMPDENIVYETFKKFDGPIKQLPPMYSAVHIKGKRLYELARQGITVERKDRDVNIYSINILKIEGNNVLFDVTCSKGTYIRALCSSIGQALGTDAVMTFLLRTKTGPFEIGNCITIDELDAISGSGNINSVLYPTEAALKGYGKIWVDDFTFYKVKNGNEFRAADAIKFEKGAYEDIVLIFNCDNVFAATGRFSEDKNSIKIDKVFA